MPVHLDMNYKYNYGSVRLAPDVIQSPGNGERLSGAVSIFIAGRPRAPIGIALSGAGIVPIIARPGSELKHPIYVLILDGFMSGGGGYLVRIQPFMCDCHSQQPDGFNLALAQRRAIPLRVQWIKAGRLSAGYIGSFFPATVAKTEDTRFRMHFAFIRRPMDRSTECRSERTHKDRRRAAVPPLQR